MFQKSALFNTLKHISFKHHRKLLATFSLVVAENVLLLIYPVIASFAVNAVVEGNLWLALSYALLVLIIWAVGSLRRAVDTRAFVRIYADLAVPIILEQRTKGSTSTAAARVGLARQFVDFLNIICPLFSPHFSRLLALP